MRALDFTAFIKGLIDFGSIFYSFLSCIGKPLFSESFNRPTTTKRAILVGNGPSLKDDYDQILGERQDASLFCVNYFATTDLFRKLKPDYYIIADPVFWREDVNNNFKIRNRELIDRLQHVDWEMTLICQKKGYKQISRIFQNHNYIKTSWVQGRARKFNLTCINLLALKYKICSPYIINVLVMSLWCALELNFKDIDIYGADFSGFKDLFVDQKTNIVVTDSSHFYKNSTAEQQQIPKYINASPKMIHIRLLQIQQSFYQMYLLSLLSKSKHVSVTNRSSMSYLDCFDRH